MAFGIAVKLLLLKCQLNIKIDDELPILTIAIM